MDAVCAEFAAGDAVLIGHQGLEINALQAVCTGVGTDFLVEGFYLFQGIGDAGTPAYLSGGKLPREK